MAVNTEALDDGKYVTMSSVSVVASRSTLAAQDVVATSSLSVGGTVTLSATTLSPSAVRVGSGAAIGPTLAFTSEASLGLFRSAASRLALSYGQFTTGDGTAILPGLAFASEVSLGLRRSAASVIQTSYGRFAADFRSASTLAASLTTANVTGAGDLAFSVLSLTANGAQFGFRSGNTTYIFYSGTSNQQV